MVEIILKTLETIIINANNIREIVLDGSSEIIVNGKSVKTRDPYKSTKCDVIMVDGTKYECHPITFHLIRVAHPIVQYSSSYTRIPEQLLK